MLVAKNFFGSQALNLVKKCGNSSKNWLEKPLIDSLPKSVDFKQELLYEKIIKDYQ